MKIINEIIYLDISDILNDIDNVTLNSLVLLSRFNTQLSLIPYSMNIQHKFNKLIQKLAFNICISIEYKIETDKDNLVLIYNNMYIFL